MLEKSQAELDENAAQAKKMAAAKVEKPLDPKDSFVTAFQWLKDKGLWRHVVIPPDQTPFNRHGKHVLKEFPDYVNISGWPQPDGDRKGGMADRI